MAIPHPPCPGAGSYGHGETLTIVHSGDCCSAWERRCTAASTPTPAAAYVRSLEMLTAAQDGMLAALARLDHPDRDIYAAQLLHDVGLWVDCVDHVLGLETTTA